MRGERKRRTRVIHLALLVATLPPALGQSSSPAYTRESVIAEAERAKAQVLTPQVAPHGEATFTKTETHFMDTFTAPNGLGLKFGGLPTGGGFSVGPRYTRRDWLHEHLISDTSIVGSTKKWYRGDTSLTLPDLLNNHMSIRADAAYENAASVPFYGEGVYSPDYLKTDFRREFTTAHLAAETHVLDHKVILGYGVGGLLANVGRGDINNNGYVSSDTVFTEVSAPGIDRQSNFITGTAKVSVNLTQPGFISRSGLVIEANDTGFWDKSGNNTDFHRLQTQATFYRPFWNGQRALVFRARNDTAFPLTGQKVPFYLQPTLGGPDDLRGYDRYRFYDAGASTLSGEYRWSVGGVMDLALFGDGGNVYDRPGLIGVRELKGDGGFGVRLKNKQQTVMRFDVGFSPKGVKVWFVFNGAFNNLFHSY